MRKIISHRIRMGDPGWPGNPTLEIENITSLEKGNVANTYVIKLFNHYGTHFDAPRHYNAAGPTINEIPLERFFYDKPLVIDVPKGELEKIEPEDLKPYEKEIRNCDLLMLRTGFEPERQNNPELYSQRGPAVSAACARYLMEKFNGSMKAVAVDFVSLACPADTTDGDEAHHRLLGVYDEGYICIIEDVSMKELPAGFLHAAAAVPIFVDGLDSAPVTMWADI